MLGVSSQWRCVFQRASGIAGGAEVRVGHRQRRSAAQQDEGVRPELQETGQGTQQTCLSILSSFER